MSYLTLDIFVAKDKTTHVRARMNIGDIYAKWPPETTLSEISSWLQDPTSREDTILENSRVPWSARDVFFDNDTGQIIINHHARQEGFDPNDEEDLARFVRKLKALAWNPNREQRTLPVELPRLTEEDLATKRTIFLTPMSAEGARRPKARKVVLERDPNVAAKLDAILNDILAAHKQRTQNA